MKKTYVTFLALLSLTLFAASCASTPPAPAAAPAPDKAPAPAMAAVPAPDAELKKAESLKETIEKYQLSFAKPDEFQKANDELAGGKELMGKDNAKAKGLLESASSRYEVVLEAGIAEGAKARQVEMSTAQQKAKEVKADIAAADKYRTGTMKMDQSSKLFAEKKYMEAWDASGESVAAFNESSEIAKAKRVQAEKSLTTTADAQVSTDAKLEEVTKEIGGTKP
jgi:hypothetical protein